MEPKGPDRSAVQPVPGMCQGERGKPCPLSGVALVNPFMKFLQLFFVYPLGDHVLGETFEVGLHCWATLCCCEGFQEGWLEDGFLLVSCTDLLLLRLPFLEEEEDRLRKVFLGDLDAPKENNQKP